MFLPLIQWGSALGASFQIAQDVTSPRASGSQTMEPGKAMAWPEQGHLHELETKAVADPVACLSLTELGGGPQLMATAISGKSLKTRE